MQMDNESERQVLEAAAAPDSTRIRKLAGCMMFETLAEAGYIVDASSHDGGIPPTWKLSARGRRRLAYMRRWKAGENHGGRKL